MDKINENEIKELIKDIPKLQNFFPDVKSDGGTIIVKDKDFNKKIFKIKMKNINKNRKLFFKKDQSFSTLNKEKDENL